jgi:hypothetical protein
MYNCKEIIDIWTGIPRKLRVATAIHRNIFEKIDKELLSIPFNPTDKFGFVKKNPLLFVLATHVKYLFNSLKHNIRR